jgi:hypothetical protein
VTQQPAKLVSQNALRALYWDNGFHDRMLNGELKGRVVANNASPLDTHPAGSRSLLIELVNSVTGECEGTVHQYVGPDGKLLASGKPDPESLVVDGQGYFRLP